MAPTVVQIRRVLTTTPLARSHEHTLTGRRKRAPRSVDFASFDRSRYSEPALALAADAQSKLALGEYRAIDSFARAAATMSRVGAPFDLVAAATIVPTDEMRHADHALRMASALTGRDVQIAAENADWAETHDLEWLDRFMLGVAAISETLSCALLSACRERATDPVVRLHFSLLVADEVHHARLGWYYLAWRAAHWSRAEQQRHANYAGEIVMDLERRFWRGRDAAPADRDAARALGVLESEGQREAVCSVVENEIVPGLDALGLGASHAWRKRRRGPERGR